MKRQRLTAAQVKDAMAQLRNIPTDNDPNPAPIDWTAPDKPLALKSAKHVTLKRRQRNR